MVVVVTHSEGQTRVETVVIHKSKMVKNDHASESRCLCGDHYSVRSTSHDSSYGPLVYRTPNPLHQKISGGSVPWEEPKDQ